ncbi:hypothetical protein [Candidatus Electronema sp. TJ]|uniref:hypothetical protein n=1 Tax=Candidatus Electronema sp. TJ TaxID=3401573 RepID=UPI003AA7FC8B
MPFDSQKACCLIWTSGTGLPARRLRALPDLLHKLSASSLQLHIINGIDSCDEAEARLKRFLLLRCCPLDMRNTFTLRQAAEVAQAAFDNVKPLGKG